MNGLIWNEQSFHETHIGTLLLDNCQMSKWFLYLGVDI
jgi:hypothetical protein